MDSVIFTPESMNYKWNVWRQFSTFKNNNSSKLITFTCFGECGLYNAFRNGLQRGMDEWLMNDKRLYFKYIFVFDIYIYL